MVILRAPNELFCFMFGSEVLPSSNENVLLNYLLVFNLCYVLFLYVSRLNLGLEIS